MMLFIFIYIKSNTTNTRLNMHKIQMMQLSHLKPVANDLKVGPTDPNYYHTEV